MRTVIIGTVIAVIALITASILYTPQPVLLSYTIRALNYWGKRKVLYGLDHQQIGHGVRAFAKRTWDEPPTGFPITYIASDEAAFPSKFKTQGASGIRIYNDRAELEFGGTPLHFGIVVFREGVEGHGIQQLGEGVWFYSEDGSR